MPRRPFYVSMETRRSYYYDINKKYLMLVGQWPYQKPKKKLICFTFIMILAATSLVPQVTLIVVKNFFWRGKKQKKFVTILRLSKSLTNL